MTTLDNFLESISYIELSDMSGASEGDGVVTSQWRNRIISILNHGLNVVHSEFSIKLVEDPVYPGSNRYEYTNEEPDFIRIDKISLNNEAIFLNDSTVNDPRIFVTGWNSFVAEGFKEDDVLVVVYRAKAEPITKSSPGETVIPVPARFEELLRAYVAWQIFLGYKDQAFAAKGMESKARYMELLQQLRELNITNEYNPELPARWFDKGWGLAHPAKLTNKE